MIGRWNEIQPARWLVVAKRRGAAGRAVAWVLIGLGGGACAAAPGPAAAPAPAPAPAPGAAPAPAPTRADNAQPLFAVDESLWTVFYDLPSRRFRAVKDAFVRGEFAAIPGDLRVSANYLRIEADRSRIGAALNAAADRLDALGAQFDEGQRGGHDLDAVFADVHWLLAQHFVALAEAARNQVRHRDAGRYLTAIAHHLERTALWSQAPVDKSLVDAVDGLRRQAARLERAPAKLSARAAYEDRPVYNAMDLIKRFGIALKRKPLIRLEARP